MIQNYIGQTNCLSDSLFTSTISLDWFIFKNEENKHSYMIGINWVKFMIEKVELKF